MNTMIPETDRGHLAAAAIALYSAACQQNTVSFMLKPRLFIDGDKWCALHGENLQDGVSGFGDSPSGAYADFDLAWCRKLNVPND